jgi:hypothetical protein
VCACACVDNWCDVLRRIVDEGCCVIRTQSYRVPNWEGPFEKTRLLRVTIHSMLTKRPKTKCDE